jgi:hypothetical protein
MQSEDPENIELADDELRQILEILGRLNEPPVLTPEGKQEAKEYLRKTLEDRGIIQRRAPQPRLQYRRIPPVEQRKTGSD